MFTKKTIFLLLTMNLFLTGMAQQDSIKRFRLYKSWISNDLYFNNPVGILYEVRDTSIVFSGSVLRDNYRSGKLPLKEISYSDINQLKVRRLNNIGRNGIIGSLIFATIPAIALFSDEGLPDDFGPVLYIGVILPFSIIGFGAGAILGSVKRTFPINNNIDHYKASCIELSRYSFLNEHLTQNSVSNPNVEHRWFAGFLNGISFPLGNFSDHSVSNVQSGFASTGYFSCIPYIGYRSSDRFGVSAMMFYSQYEAEKNGQELWYGIGGFLAGPLISLSKKGKFRFDLKPETGFSSAQYLDGEDIIKVGNGIALNLSLSTQFNLSKRFCLFAEQGIFLTRQKFNDNSNMNISTINLDLGIGYRFK